VRRALAVWALLLAVYATGLGLRAAPGEDLSAGEAHVLLTVQSVARDGDLDLADDYGERAWREDFGGDVVPAAGPRDGRQLEPAGLLYVAVAAPAYAAGGRLAVQLLGAALLAAAFAAAVPAARRLVPDPWATAGVLVAALSPPAVLAATTIAPDPLAAALLAGAAALALRVREGAGGVLPVHAFWAAALVAAVPWAGVRFAAPAAVVAWATSRWLRRRRRGLAGLVVLEVVLFSVVTFVSVNDRLYGGPLPGATLPPPGPTGADGLAAHLERWPRLLGLWIDRDAGLVRWAPVALLVLAAAVLLWRAHRERLVAALPQLVDVEVAGGFLLAACAAQALAAAFLAPSIAGPWPPAHLLVCVAPLGAAAAAPALRRLPRTGRALAALTLVATVWTLVAVRVDGDAGVAPPQGPLPWGGLERVLPELR
jgi:hypothetical protein